VPGREGPSLFDAGRRIPSLYRAVLYLVPLVTFASLGSMTQTLIPVIGDEDLGLSAGSIGLALGIGGIARLVSSIVAGQVSDRVSRKSALVPGMLAQGAGIALLAAGPSLFLWLTAIVIIGLGSLGVAVSGTMLADLSRGSGVGRQFGPFRFVGDVGLIAGPPIVAWLFENHGTAAAVIPLAVVVIAVGLAVAFLVPETRWLEEDDPTQA
jgi:MFS family permease